MFGCVRGIPLCPGPDHIPQQKEGCDREANHCDISSETGSEGHKREKVKACVLFLVKHTLTLPTIHKVFSFFLFCALKISVFLSC